MSNLEKLLDERYPAFDSQSTQIAISRRLAERAAFTEGYNAAIEAIIRTSPEVMQNPFIKSIRVRTNG
jgi:hypothetical protein